MKREREKRREEEVCMYRANTTLDTGNLSFLVSVLFDFTFQHLPQLTFSLHLLGCHFYNFSLINACRNGSSLNLLVLPLVVLS
ncbi:hypothetical protein CSUI_007118, partial [Cystoisospora suis]